MALKDEDTLMKRKRELEEAIRNLGLTFDNEEIEEIDEKNELDDQFMMDEEALRELIQNNEEK